MTWHIFRNGWKDKRFIKQRVHGFEEARKKIDTSETRADLEKGQSYSPAVNLRTSPHLFPDQTGHCFPPLWLWPNMAFQIRAIEDDFRIADGRLGRAIHCEHRDRDHKRAPEKLAGPTTMREKAWRR
jgi:hypothetical protein